MDDPVVPFDLLRMVIGENPPLFYLEILVRTLIIYTYTLVLLRWLGGRTIGQLSTIEFLLVIALGSAVGDPMFYPDVPIFHALLVITLIVLMDKGLDHIVARTRRGEQVIDGTPREVILDGIVKTEELKRAILGRNEFFRELRREGISNIGEVHRAYIEANGELSIFRQSPPRTGLPIVPPLELTDCLISGSTAQLKGTIACRNCGQTLECKQDSTIPPCPYCHHTQFSVVQ